MRTQAVWKADKSALPSEMVSLSERLSLMLIVRVAMVVVAMTSGYFGVKMESGAAGSLLGVSAVYVAVSLLCEGLRRVGGGRGLVVIGLMLLVDGVYLGWVTYATGGAHSPLRFLLFAHLVTVTLLASFRTGLKIALWHSLLVVVAFYAQLAGFLVPVEVTPGTADIDQSPFHRMSVYNLIAFWVVAVATAAYSAFNERNLRRRGFDLEALATMATEMDEVTDSVGAAKRLVKVAADTFSFKRAAVLVLVDGELTIAADRRCGGRPSGALEGDASLQESRETLRALLLRSIDPSRDPALAALFPDGKRVLLVPLVVEGNWVGVLVAESSGKRRYRVDENVLTVVEQFANHAALALSNVWLLEQVQSLAHTDSLTKVANRMRFDEILDAEINRSLRSSEPFGLLMLDIDHFKTLNDNLGHQAGDDVLRRLAQALKDECRDFDTVARYGGEEFAVILPMADPDSAVRTAERLRRTVERLDTAAPITISVGVAAFPYNGRDADGLVRAADVALYESKFSGRNRVTASPIASLQPRAVGA